MLVSPLVQIIALHVASEVGPAMDKGLERRLESEPLELACHAGVVLQDLSQGCFQPGALDDDGIGLELLAAVLALDIPD